MRHALVGLYWLQKRAWRLFRPRTQGVKVILLNADGEIVLIRNSYGRSDLFVLPGGGVRPFEAPSDAARREVAEELGLEVRELTLVSQHSSGAEGKRDTVHLFKGLVDRPPAPDRVEVQEARFFALNDLPAKASPATRRRICEFLGELPADGNW